MTEFRNERLNQSYYTVKHQSGLTILLCPNTKFKTAYALFGASVGSVDNVFAIDGGEEIRVPNGIAHFLEHKLFESEEGDIFDLYAKVGASANAYTSFDRTAYLFSCTENFERSLEILIDLVTKPYFTEATVAKEQGIIGQEIRMYDDDPDWRVLFNLLGALYQANPIRIDIAGTIESISEITAKTLYDCHKAFYNLNNMVLSIAGNFEIEAALAVCDRMLAASEGVTLTRTTAEEPREVTQDYVEQTLAVAAPLFQYGFKGVDEGYGGNILAQVTGEIVCDIIAGESSRLYRRLYDEGLINATFGSETMAGRGYLATVFSGESRNPRLVADEIAKEIERLGQEGISPEDFARAKKACYGRYIGIYSSVEAMAGMMLLAELADIGVYQPLDLLEQLTLNDAQAYLRENLDCRYSALSVVRGESA